ncbi:hypothetical protein VINI7043_26038 [Vibrio nigripulchritudo ATCC 27043]|nr:hypothetical protein VINI7043_26038 [Vibrio nigripulchritudo ATCC 27043]
MQQVGLIFKQMIIIIILALGLLRYEKHNVKSIIWAELSILDKKINDMALSYSNTHQTSVIYNRSHLLK